MRNFRFICAIAIFIMAGIEGYTQDIHNTWVMHAANVHYCENGDGYNFNGYDQNCTYVADQYQCREASWSFEENGGLAMRTIYRYPEHDLRDTSLIEIIYSTTPTQITFCDDVDTNCHSFNYSIVNDTLRIFGFIKQCQDSEMVFVPVAQE